MCYKLETINLVIIMYTNTNGNIKTISNITNISKSTIYNWFNKYKYNFINNVPIIDLNMKKEIHGLSKKHLYKEKVINCLNEQKIYRKKDILINNPDIKISLSTLARIIKISGYTYKNIKNKILPYSEEILIAKRKEYSEKIINTEDKERYMNYISLDESSFCINDYSKKSYCKKGIKNETTFKHKRGRERYTLLLAISKNEIVNYDIFKGALNLEIYKKFIENNKDNFRNKTIINDNLRIHKNKTIIDYCDMNNISLSFIPPYSPDFNPIENYFSEAKRIFRRYNNHELLKDDIIRAINETNKENLIKYYERSFKFIEKYSNINLQNLIDV